MPTIRDIEKIVSDYERRITGLKQLEQKLQSMDTKGFEQETRDILQQLKDPRSLEQVEEQITQLEKKIMQRQQARQQEEKQQYQPPQPPKRAEFFPYELTSDYKDIGLIGKGGFARVFRANRRSDGKEVAVKIPIAPDRSIGKSFMRESRSSPTSR